MTNGFYFASQIVLLVSVLFAMGCVQQHYIQANNGSLTFYYNDKEARKIYFASSIDHFHSHAAIKGPGGMWEVTVPQHKEFVYFYIVDGEITVPDCPDVVLDDFGNKNCFYVSDM